MLSQKIKYLFADRIVQNASWLGGAEFANRIFRLATTFILTRTFSPDDYGLMAFIYVAFEFASVFIRVGVSAKVIHAAEAELQEVCDTAYWLCWLMALGAFLVQCGIAYPLSVLYNNPNLWLPLCVSAIAYLAFPFFLIQTALVERLNQMKQLAVINSIQSISSNLLIVGLALSGFGIGAIVTAILLTTPLWIFANRYQRLWKPPQRFTLSAWQQIAVYSRNVTGIELLSRLRGNIDYLIVGKILGFEALGMYYFAFNAGSGITMNFVNAFIWAFFPHLCSVRADQQKLKQEFYRNLKRTTILITCIVLAQVVLSPFYVPIIAGPKWIPAIPVLVLICLSVIPNSVKMAASILLSVADKPHLTLYFDVIYTIVFTIAILGAVSYGIYWVAATVLACHLVLGLGFALWSSKKVFAQSPKPS
jgi:O-antigen/teichoic acid export membrane protein